MAVLTQKQCSRCELDKDIDQFSRHNTSKDGRFPYCKLCASTADKTRRLIDPERTRLMDRQYNMKSTYGLTTMAYATLLEKQQGGCAVCGKAESGHGRTSALLPDHNHVTGEIRGLLCHGCNMGLGGFKDNPELLEKAAEYIRSRI